MTAFEGFPRDGFAYSAADVGEALAGLIRRDSNGFPIPGMLSAPVVTAVPAAWKVEISPFTFVAVSGAAVQFTGLSAAEQVDIASAVGIPAGQGRIDVVCWDAADDELIVVEGVVSGSPVAPSTSGLEPVVQVRVNSGDGAVIAGQVTPVFARTGLVSDSRKTQGTVSKQSLPAGGLVEVNVSFEAGLFTEAPVVIATPWGSARGGDVQVDTVTTSGFILKLISDSPNNRSLGAQWRAEQM